MARGSKTAPLSGRRWPAIGVIAFGVITILVQQAGAAALDSDGDGWYDAKRNQRITLTLVGLTSSRGGNYSVTVDGVRFPFSDAKLLDVVRARPETTAKLDLAVASRAIGVWSRKLRNHPSKWKATVVVTRYDTPPVRRSATLTWDDRPGEQSLVVDFSPDEQVRLDLSTTVERFADPAPANRDGDTDRDGLLDWEEAEYARRGVALGDPERKDLILVVGYTHRQWRMTDLTKRLLKTCFRRRQINLYVAADRDTSLGLCRPGLVKLDDKTVGRDKPINLRQARRMRRASLDAPLAGHAHFVVLAARVAPKPDSSWGYAELPGATLIVRSHLPMLGPDFHQYQAKTLLHELGHNLGLCHPTQSDDGCISGPIPEAERNPAVSVMGTPRSDRGNPLAVLSNAWARPLDYSPTQWKNARLDWVRRENRP